MSERERIARLQAIFGPAPAGVALGIGDDAAVLLPGAGPLVWSVDQAVEHVHFERRWLDAECLGYRATMAALSDLAAMGARPRGVLAALAVPPDLDDAWFDGIARGQRRACDECATAMLGGNLSRAGELSIATTVLGEAPRPMRRDRAKPGDALWLAGPVGLARAGLEHLLLGNLSDAGRLASWRFPTARIAEGLQAAERCDAAIDVSDGLALDAFRLAEASGVALVFDGAALVDDVLRDAAASVGRAPLELALYGGEDYALLVAAPPELGQLGTFRRVGHVRTPSDSERASGALLHLEEDGAVRPVAARGFDHFDAASERAILS